MDALGHHFWDGFGHPFGITFGIGFGSLGDTTWEMEKAGFGEAQLTSAGQQPLWFEAQLGVPFWIPWGITFGMDLGSLRASLLGWIWGAFGTPLGGWKKQVSARPG